MRLHTRKAKTTPSKDRTAGFRSINWDEERPRSATAVARFRDKRDGPPWQASLGGLSFTVLAFIILFATQSSFGQGTAGVASSDGRDIYGKNCSNCHGALGQGLSGIISIAGPSLQAEHDSQTVLETVQTGKGIMPSFKPILSQRQMDAVADYVTRQLAIIPLAGGNLSEGGTLFRVYCAPCHGTPARGGALAFAGVNAPSLVRMSPGTIAGTIRWGPGPMPSFPASAISDKQLDSIVMYVQFLQHPPNPGGTTMRYYGSVAEGFIAWIAIFLLVATAGWIEKKGQG